jgi:hypothetical protein
MESCSALRSGSDAEAHLKVPDGGVAAGVKEATRVVVEDVEGASLLLTTGQGLGFVLVVVAVVLMGAAVFGVFAFGSCFEGCGVGDLNKRAKLETELGSNSVAGTVSISNTSDIKHYLIWILSF